jgi:hypothetical protein
MEARYRPQVCTFCGVIPEIDMARRRLDAQALQRDGARGKHPARANELAAAGDQNGAAVWVGMLERHSATSSIQMQQRG